MAGTDFTHLTQDELINGIPKNEIPDYIRTKAYGEDVRETIAQSHEVLVDDFYTGLENFKNYVATELEVPTSEFWDGKFEAKYAEIESTYAPRLTTVEQSTQRFESTLIGDFEFDELAYPPTPANFPDIKPPFRVYRGIDGKIKHDFEFDSFETSAGHVYLKGYEGGSDTNSGLTSALPVSTLAKALEIANGLTQTSVVIHVLSNAIDDSRLLPNAFTLQKNIILKSESSRGRTFFHSGNRPTSVTWTADGTAYKCTRSTVTEVFDTSLADGKLPKMMKKVSSVAEVQAEANTWYTDGTSVWVRRTGDKAPDSDVALILPRGAKILTINLGDFKFITRDIEFYFNVSVGDAVSIKGTQSGEFWNENCVFAKSQTKNGLSTEGVLKTYSFNSEAFLNGLDGFNYHTDLTLDVRNYAFEFGCKAYNSTNTAVSNANATTAHEGYATLRINGEYYNTYGPILADVNGCFSVAYDTAAYNSLRSAGPDKAAFDFSSISGVKSGVAYLINCAGGGADTYSITSDNALPVYIKDFKGKEIYTSTDLRFY